MDFSNENQAIDAAIANTYVTGQSARRRGLFFAAFIFATISFAIYIRQ